MSWEIRPERGDPNPTGLHRKQSKHGGGDAGKAPLQVGDDDFDLPDVLRCLVLDSVAGCGCGARRHSDGGKS